MKAFTVVLFGLLLAVPAVVGEEYTDFTAWMKACHESYNALRQMDNKTGRQAIHHAERLGGIYEEMIGFWRQRDQAAAKLAIQGKATLVILAAAAYSNDNAKATQAVADLGATCDSCHKAHRIKLPDGKYGFKPQW